MDSHDTSLIQVPVPETATLTTWTAQSLPDNMGAFNVVTLLPKDVSGAVLQKPVSDVRRTYVGRYLWDHVKEFGNRVVVPSISKPCTWNQGQKRKKQPKPLHLATYESSKRKKGQMYHFDPRRPETRGHNQTQLNNFLFEVKTISTNSMWLEHLGTVDYKDFSLNSDDVILLRQMVLNFKSSLIGSLEGFLAGATSDSTQIPRTEKQSESTSWHLHRWSHVNCINS